MKIIPAIDILDGKCVRLTQGDYNQKKIYNENPLEVALEFEEAGIEQLHLVDLDGAKAKHIVNYKVLETIAKGTNLKIDFGGGLKTDEDLKIAFDNGAHQITGGSIAVKDRDTFKRWIQRFGAEKIILGADVRDEKIATSGWLETSDENLLDFLKEYAQEGIQNVICTDISKDGLLEGPSTVLYRKIRNEFPTLNLIASGGVSNMQDLNDLREINCFGAIVGKAIYERRISLEELKNF